MEKTYPTELELTYHNLGEVEHYLSIAGFYELKTEDVLNNFAKYYENENYNGVIIIPAPSTSIYKYSNGKLSLRLIGIKNKEEFDILDDLITNLINSLHP